MEEMELSEKDNELVPVEITVDSLKKNIYEIRGKKSNVG